MKYTNKEIQFIHFVKSECENSGIKHSLRNVKYVKFSPTIKCAGWFDEDKREIVVSMNRPDWIEILAHEYSHLTQWKDKLPLWQKAEISLKKLDHWIEGKYVKNIEHHASVCRDLELDNEKRTVKIIKKFKLNVDLEKYVKKCNAYVLFYNWILITRRWSKPENSPYTNEIVISAMSNKFNMNYTKLSKKVKKAFYLSNL